MYTEVRLSRTYRYSSPVKLKLRKVIDKTIKLRVFMFTAVKLRKLMDTAAWI
jgi:hypothetical protein